MHITHAGFEIFILFNSIITQPKSLASCLHIF
jgi:hypothetical protein